MKTIQLVKSADFKVEYVNVDLHKRVTAAILQGKFNSHNMRERVTLGSGPNILAEHVGGSFEEILGEERMQGQQELHPMDPYPSSWLRYGVASITCNLH